MKIGRILNTMIVAPLSMTGNRWQRYFLYINKIGVAVQPASTSVWTLLAIYFGASLPDSEEAQNKLFKNALFKEYPTKLVQITKMVAKWPTQYMRRKHNRGKWPTLNTILLHNSVSVKYFNWHQVKNLYSSVAFKLFVVMELSERIRLLMKPNPFRPSNFSKNKCTGN